GAAADERQSRLGPTVLHEPEHADRARDVVEVIEIPRRYEVWPQRGAFAIAKSIQIDDVRDDARGDAERSKDIDEKTRRDDVLVDAAEGPARDGRALEMIGRLAAAVIEHDRLAERPRDQNRRQRREQKRRIRCREHVDDIGARQLPNEERDVRQFGDDGPCVLDVDERLERAGWNRIDRYEPRVDIWVVLPRA